MVNQITRSFAALAAAAALSVPAGAVVVLTAPVYLQNFDTLASTGTSSVLPAGWQLAELGANANDSYTAGSGTNNAGNTYSFGAAGSAERALGSLASAALQPRFGLVLTNGLTETITSVNISYFGELWRIGTSGNSNSLGFSYSIDAAAVGGPGTFLNVPTLDFTVAPVGPTGALDGNANRSFITGTIGGLSLAPGATLVLRWTAQNAPGNDHAMGVDDFRLQALGPGLPVPEPASWALLLAGFGGIGAAARVQRRTARA